MDQEWPLHYPKGRQYLCLRASIVGTLQVQAYFGLSEFMSFHSVVQTLPNPLQS
jgi:hypothetical protein